MLSASPCPPRVLRLWFWIARHFANRPIYVGILVTPLAVATPLAQSSIDTRQQNQMVSERALAGAEGATGSTATFTPDLFSGALSTTVPLEIPAARRNVQPSLSLLYRSANPNGWIGVGWELELGAIERDTLPRANASELSYLFKGGGGAQQLVSVGPDEYRSKIEGAFLRIKRVSGTDGGPAWVVVDRTGRRYFFGTDAASRLADPGSPLKNVFRWALDRIEDAHGNYAVVTYSRFPESTAQLYVNRVDYNGSRISSPNLSVVFETEPRPDGLVMTRPGFVVRTTRRLSAVRVLANGALVREYVIAYRQVLSQSLLESVTQKDGSGQLSFPSTAFAYSTGGAVWPTVAGNNGPAPAVPVSTTLSG